MSTRTVSDIIVSESWDLEQSVIFYTDVSKTTTENISGYSYEGAIKASFSATETLLEFTPTVIDGPGGELEIYITKEDIALLTPIECVEDSKRMVDVGVYRIVKTRASDNRELPCLEGKIIKDRF